MQLAWEQSSNRLTVTVFDGEGLSEPFVFVWSPDGGFDPSGRIGFTYHDGGGAGPGIGLFDNLTIVPEPSTGALVCLGLGGLAVGGRTRARSGRRGGRPETEQTGAVWRLASSENTVEKLRLLN